MKNKITEVISSRKKTFILLATVIFFSGVVFGATVSFALKRQPPFGAPPRNPGVFIFKFIDNVSLLADTEEKQQEIRALGREALHKQREMRSTSIKQNIISDIEIVSNELQNFIPEANQSKFAAEKKKLMDELNESVLRKINRPPHEKDHRPERERHQQL